MINQFVTLIGHIAWPLTVVILLYMTRHLFSRIAEAIAKRIENPASDFSLGPQGVAVSGVVDRSRIESTDTQAKLEKQIKDQPTFEKQLKGWLQEQTPYLSVTALLNGETEEELRKKAVQQFGL